STMFPEMEMNGQNPLVPCCGFHPIHVATGASSHRRYGLNGSVPGDDRGSSRATKPIWAPGSAYLRGCRANKAPISFTDSASSL
ncbi:hypothetical protein QBC45DRAFT_288448, partial [Copromyces sp. CBS 386.78]